MLGRLSGGESQPFLSLYSILHSMSFDIAGSHASFVEGSCFSVQVCHILLSPYDMETYWCFWLSTAQRSVSLSFYIEGRFFTLHVLYAFDPLPLTLQSHRTRGFQYIQGL